MQFRCLPSPVLLGVLLVSIGGCPAKPDEQAKPEPAKAEPAKSEPAKSELKRTKLATASCPADPSWISSPSLPGDVPSPVSNCGFQQFMWQSLLYLVQPSSSPGELNFETWMPEYGIFVGANQT